MRSATLVLTALLTAGCGVSSADYESAVKDADDARAEAQGCYARAQVQRARIALLVDEVRRMKMLAAERDEELTGRRAQTKDLQSKLDVATAQNAELRRALEKMGKDADELLGDKGALASSLMDARARLDELRTAQAAAEARVSLYRELAGKLRRMTEANEVSLALRHGRMVIGLPNDALFDAESTYLKPAGQKALKELAAVLRTIPRREFQVAGHTDNAPVQSARFGSNWELSNERAVAVVHFLIGQGVTPHDLSAAGYGEYDPVASNDSTGGQARNRRIEITLQPNMDEIVSAPVR